MFINNLESTAGDVSARLLRLKYSCEKAPPQAGIAYSARKMPASDVQLSVELTIGFCLVQRAVLRAPAEVGASSSSDVSSIGVAKAELMPLLRISLLLMKADIDVL